MVNIVLVGLPSSNSSIAHIHSQLTHLQHPQCDDIMFASASNLHQVTHQLSVDDIYVFILTPTWHTEFHNQHTHYQQCFDSLVNDTLLHKIAILVDIPYAPLAFEQMATDLVHPLDFPQFSVHRNHERGSGGEDLTAFIEHVRRALDLNEQYTASSGIRFLPNSIPQSPFQNRQPQNTTSKDRFSIVTIWDSIINVFYDYPKASVAVLIGIAFVMIFMTYPSDVSEIPDIVTYVERGQQIEQAEATTELSDNSDDIAVQQSTHLSDDLSSRELDDDSEVFDSLPSTPVEYELALRNWSKTTFAVYDRFDCPPQLASCTLADLDVITTIKPNDVIHVVCKIPDALVENEPVWYQVRYDVSQMDSIQGIGIEQNTTFLLGYTFIIDALHFIPNVEVYEILPCDTHELTYKLDELLEVNP